MAIENGSIADADEVMNVMGSLLNDSMQNLFNADYLGFDSRLYNSGIPNLKNVYYSTFTSDDAIDKTGFEYDATNDLYIPNLIVLEGTTQNSPNVTTFSGNADLNWSITANEDIIVSSIIIEPNSTANYTVDIVQNSDIIATKTLACVGGVVKSFTFDSSDYSRAIESGQIFSITSDAGGPTILSLPSQSQTGSLFSYTNQTIPGENGSDTLFMTAKQVLIATESILTVGTSTDVGENITNIIPIVNSDFDTGDATLSFSNDGSTFEACINKKVHRPSTTGQKRLLKITGPVGAALTSSISEFSIKHNLY